MSAADCKDEARTPAVSDAELAEATPALHPGPELELASDDPEDGITDALLLERADAVVDAVVALLGAG